MTAERLGGGTRVISGYAFRWKTVGPPAEATDAFREEEESEGEASPSSAFPRRLHRALPTTLQTGEGAENLLDELLGARSLADAFLVLARDELGDQAEREDLEPDDDEQDAEDQQRPLADRGAADLDRGQVEERRDPGQGQEQAEPAEEVQRPVPVPADERDREEVEEAPQVALEAVARAAVLGRWLTGSSAMRKPRW
jgi:hypothetical protein